MSSPKNSKSKMHHTCQNILPLLQLYVDGELAEMESNAVEGHIDHCPDCAGILADEFSLRQTLRDGYTDDCAAPQRLKENIQAWLSLQAVKEADVANDESPSSKNRADHVIEDSIHGMPFRGFAIGALMLMAAALAFFVVPKTESGGVLIPRRENVSVNRDLDSIQILRDVPKARPQAMPLSFTRSAGVGEIKGVLNAYGAHKKPGSSFHSPYRPVSAVPSATRLHHSSSKPRLKVLRKWKPVRGPINLVRFPSTN